MAETVTISVEVLETLTQAAGEWSEELSQHIAPASRDFGDEESAESQEQQADDIGRAYGHAAFLISDARNG